MHLRCGYGPDAQPAPVLSGGRPMHQRAASCARFHSRGESPQGAGGPGGNPEQLFPAGYSGCFLGALKFVAARSKVALPADTRVICKVGIGPLPNPQRLSLALPGPGDIWRIGFCADRSRPSPCCWRSSQCYIRRGEALGRNA